jgi:hypothetical protein
MITQKGGLHTGSTALIKDRENIDVFQPDPCPVLENIEISAKVAFLVLTLARYHHKQP